MPQDDPIINSDPVTGGTPADDQGKSDNKGATDPAKKRRRRPRRRKPTNRIAGGTPTSADMAVTDVSLASAEIEEEMNKSFVGDEIDEEVKEDLHQPKPQVLEPMPISDPAPEEIPVNESVAVAPEPIPTAPSYEPSPFDLAASFDNNANSSNRDPHEPQVEPATIPESVAPPPSYEPSPFDLSQPPTYDSPAPAPAAPSPFDPIPTMDSVPDPAPTPEPVPAMDPTPAPSPTHEPSPFDLASSYGNGGTDGFGDYQSPFGGGDSHPVEESASPSIHEPVTHEPIKPVEPEERKNEPEAKNQSPEVVEGEVVSEENVGHEPEIKEESLNSLAMEGSLMGKLEKLMQEANLTPRHLKFCCGGILIVILVILGGVFLAPKLLESGKSFMNNRDKTPIVNNEESGKPSTEEEQVEEEVSTPSQEVNVPVATPDSTGVVWVDPSVYSGILLGDPGADIEGTTGVDTGVLVGDDEKVDYSSKLQVFIADLEDMYNLYNVDIKVLLDESKNRTKTLDDHIAKMKEFYNLGIDHYEELGTMKVDLSAQFDENTLLKDEAETKVFDALSIQILDGQVAEEQMNSFILYKQNEADLKARYYVLANLETLYEKVLSSSYDKIKDFELNREALIAGVQVVDVEGSDIDLILTEFDLEK